MAAISEIVDNIRGEITWGLIQRNWGDILAFLRASLPILEEWQFDANGVKERTQRALIEDIVCCYAAKDNRLMFYLAEAGMDVTLSGDRPPRIINIGAKHKLPLGTGGRGVKK